MGSAKYLVGKWHVENLTSRPTLT